MRGCLLPAAAAAWLASFSGGAASSVAAWPSVTGMLCDLANDLFDAADEDVEPIAHFIDLVLPLTSIRWVRSPSPSAMSCSRSASNARAETTLDCTTHQAHGATQYGEDEHNQPG